MQRRSSELAGFLLSCLFVQNYGTGDKRQGEGGERFTGSQTEIRRITNSGKTRDILRYMRRYSSIHYRYFVIISKIL